MLVGWLLLLCGLVLGSSTPNSRITTLTECYKKGRQIDCAWNPQVIQNDGYPRVCEPTQSFLGVQNYTEECRLSSSNNFTCTFDTYSQCTKRSDTQCIDPPLWVLFDQTRQMMRASSLITQNNQTVSQVLQKTLACTEYLINATCVLDPQCVWDVTEYTRSTEVYFPPTRSTVQVISNLGVVAPPSSVLDVKHLAMVSPNKQSHANYITLTCLDIGCLFVLTSSETTTATTKQFNFISTPNELANGIKTLLKVTTLTVTQNQATGADLQRSWVVHGSRVGDLIVEGQSMVLTRHARTVQIIQRIGAAAVGGTFSVLAGGIRSPAIAYDATATDLYLVLQAMLHVDQIPVFGFVSVSKPNVTSWLVEFTAQVLEFEPNNLRLQLVDVGLVNFAGATCCQMLTSAVVTSPVLPNIGYVTKFTFASTQPTSPALLYRELGPRLLYSNNNLSATIVPLLPQSCLRFRGNYYTVEWSNATFISVLEPLVKFRPSSSNNDSNVADLRRDYGYAVFPCTTYPQTAMSSLTLNATESLLLAVTLVPEWINSVSLHWESLPNEYGEFQVRIELNSTEGVVPNLSVSADLFSADTIGVSPGFVSPSGRLRALVYFNSSSTAMDQFRIYTLMATAPGNTFGSVSANFRMLSGSRGEDDSLAVFTKEVEPAGLLSAMMEALPPLFSVTLINSTLDRSTLAITHPIALDQLPPVVLSEGLLRGANATLLATVLPRVVSPKQAALELLFKTFGPLEAATNALESPCRMDSVQREKGVEVGFGNYSKLQELDTVATSCATIGGKGESLCVGSTSTLGGLCAWRGPASTQAYDSSLVNTTVIAQLWSSRYFGWGPNAFTQHSNCTVGLVVAINGLISVMQPLQTALKAYELNSTLATVNVTRNQSTTFAGRNGLNLSRVFQSLYLQVSGDVQKFEKCLTNPTYKATYSQSAFVDVWRTIFQYTGITCMAFYLLAGALLAHRMDKFKLVTFNLWDAATGVVIVCCSMVVGGSMGFIAGAIPAALLSQIYASVPVQLSDEWAISLGVVQGLLIVYFDMGRGGAGAELAFRNGE
ncbi:hypothetical protein BASA81_001788 [Batrachochytrium salamandrivorans]|nr:hypothetical protein BASA81_001788 [Batrachochytrium salamandrivorans]